MVNYSSLKGGSKFGGNGFEASPSQQKVAKTVANKNKTYSSTGGPTGPAIPNLGTDGTSKNLAQQLGLQKYTPGLMETSPVPEAHTPPKMSFTQYLQLAQQMLGSGTTVTPDLSVFANQASQVQGQAGDADAKLAAMYSALQNNFNSQAPAIAAQYKAASNDLAANSDQAATSTNKGYQAAENSLAAQLKAQGIGDALGTIANKGTSLQAGQAQALANIQQNKAATLNHNTGDGQAALTYNRGVGDAAQLAGGEARATNQLNLQKALQAIAANKASAEMSAQTTGAPSASAITDLAQQLFQNDPNSEYADTPAEQLKGSAAATAANKAATAASSAKNSSKKARATVYTALLNAFNGDEAKATAALKNLGY